MSASSHDGLQKEIQSMIKCPWDAFLHMRGSMESFEKSSRPVITSCNLTMKYINTEALFAAGIAAGINC
jgi:hypothetical protein